MFTSTSSSGVSAAGGNLNGSRTDSSSPCLATRSAVPFTTFAGVKLKGNQLLRLQVSWGVSCPWTCLIMARAFE